MNELLSNLLSDKKKVLLAVIFIVIIAYLDMSMIMKSQLAGVKKKESQIKELKAKFANFERDLLKMGEQKKKESAGTMEPQKGKKLLSHDSLVALMHGISGLANKDNVKILKMAPAEQQPVAVKGPVAPAPAIRFQPVVIRLDLLSDYHALGSFINDIENDQILVLVQEFGIIADKQDPLKQRVNLVLKTYVKK